MNKRIIAVLISLTILVSVTSSAFALYADPEETTVEAVETTAELISDSQAETEASVTDATEAPTETQAPETTPAETEATSEETTVPETTEAPTFQTVEETTAASESISSDVEIYETQDGEVKKVEESAKDPRLKVFFFGLVLGLIMGGLCGWFLATFIIKQKLARQHDDMYAAIKHGQKSIAEKTDMERKQAEKEERMKRKKGEELLRKARADELKKEKEKKKKELARKKDAEKLAKLQAKMGIPVTAIEPEPEPEKEKPVEVEYFDGQPEEPAEDAVEHDPEIIEEYTIQKVKAEVLNDDSDSEEEIVRPEDMEYQGEDNLGDPYYTDPSDPTNEPFRIINGKKVFYD